MLIDRIMAKQRQLADERAEKSKLKMKPGQVYPLIENEPDLPLSNLIRGYSGVVWPKPSLYKASFQDPDDYFVPKDDCDVELKILEAIDAVYKEI